MVASTAGDCGYRFPYYTMYIQRNLNVSLSEKVSMY